MSRDCDASVSNLRALQQMLPKDTTEPRVASASKRQYCELSEVHLSFISLAWRKDTRAYQRCGANTCFVSLAASGEEKVCE